MKHRLVYLVPFVTMAFIACGGQIDSRGDSTEPASDPSGSSTASGSTGSGTTTTAGNGRCADVAGTWLTSESDCASDDLVIAQDGCNVAVRWYSPFNGTISGDAIVMKESNDPDLVCTATVSGKSISGSCKGTKADGGPYDCTFAAIFQSK